MIPQYIISAGSISADASSLTDSGLPLSLRVDLRLNQINTAVLRFAANPGDTAAVGDPVTVELGDENSTQKVFTGIVTELRHHLDAVTVWASSSMEALTRLRMNKFYEQQKAGDIVSDIASVAELSTGTVETGLDYPFYALGADRHLLAHVHALAARDGFDSYADPEDALVFAPYDPSATYTARYGAEILAFQQEEVAMAADGVEVYGESPASLGEGDKAYSWLTKSEVKGTAGASSGNVLRVQDMSIRNQDAAGTAAEKILAARQVQKQGWAMVLGTQDPVLGGAVEFQDLPDSNLNGTYKITAIRHQLDKVQGFITTIWWREE